MVSGRFATISAPLVENGLTSTIVEDTARAATRPTALIPPPVIIPIGVPLVVNGGVDAALFVAALAISSTIVDVSPFSTNGALMVANRPDTITEEAFYKQILRYSMLVVVVGPLLVWAAIVLPGWV